MKYQQLKVGERHWHTYFFGTGAHGLIALHGFGESGHAFFAWEEELSADFTLIAVDLPFHGGASDWPAVGFGPDEVLSLIDHLLLHYSCKSYSLIGYSLGARIVEAVRPRLKKIPDGIWLLAPDGLATRRLALVNIFPLSLRSWIGKRIEKQVSLWLHLARRLYQIGVLDTFSVRYLRSQLADPLRRRRLMGVWASLPRLPIHKKKLLQAAIEAEPPIYLVIGRKDELIGWNNLKTWLEQWPEDKLYVFENQGHRLINEAVVRLLSKKIKISIGHGRNLKTK